VWFATFILMKKPSLQMLLTFLGRWSYMKIEDILNILIHIFIILTNIINIIIIFIGLKK